MGRIGHFVFHHWYLWLSLIIVYYVVGATTAVWEAWYDVRNRKKEPMYWCGKCKTYFKKEYALQLFPGMGVDVSMCPVCYKKSVFDDPNKKLKVS